MTLLARLESMLASGQDSALLRFSLGNEYLRGGQTARAETQFEAAVAQDPHYSAAWKQLGKTRTELGRPRQARMAFAHGIEVARSRGDIQAAREMEVFLKRLDKSERKEKASD